jgi:hypothetical protein
MADCASTQPSGTERRNGKEHIVSEIFKQLALAGDVWVLWTLIAASVLSVVGVPEEPAELPAIPG